MGKITTQELEAAQKSISSTLRKNEKVYETLIQKQKPRTAQLNMVSKNIKNLQVMLALIEARLDVNYGDALQAEDLEEVIKTIPQYREQIEKIKPKFKEGTSQFTLAVRRIDAYGVALTLAQETLLEKLQP